MSDLLAAVVEDEDLAYEEEVARNPYSVRAWVRYIAFKQTSNLSPRARAFAVDLLYERALRALPGSYKLWHAYLALRTARVRAARPQCAAVRAVWALYERALLTMHKMPLIWLAYLHFLTGPASLCVARARAVFDRALRALPVAQHDLLWPLYLDFARSPSTPPATARRVWRRHLLYDPAALEAYIDVLVAQGAHAEAARRLVELLDRVAAAPARRTPAGRTHAQVWRTLAALLARHPRETADAFDTEAIIRAGIQRQQAQQQQAQQQGSVVGAGNKKEGKEKKEEEAFAPPSAEKDETDAAADASTVGDLWVLLTEWQIRQGHLERARDVFEEAVGAVATVADYAVVWDAYSQFEDQVIAQSIALVEGADAAAAAAGTATAADKDAAEDARALLEMRMERYEALLARHPLLVNAVFLRQDPHNVHQWFRRIHILERQCAEQESSESSDKDSDSSNRYAAVAAAYTEALKTVDPQRATGSPHLLWAAFARFYDAAGGYAQACAVFEKGVVQPFRRVDDVASLWCEYAEMELRHGHTVRARDVARRAVARPSDAAVRRHGTNAQRWGHTSAKLWALHCDLEECYGTPATTAAAYEGALEVRAATPQMVLNYAALLAARGRHEESYRAYERGVALFAFPHARPIWITFLTRFVQRFRGRKLERARDLFEQVLAQAPPADAAVFYVMYASLEEEYGLLRRAMAVYDRAVRGVAPDDRGAMYLLYVARAGEYFGVTKTRDIYEHALQDSTLPLAQLRRLGLRFAALERRLGEYDRARAVYVHCAQFCNPATEPELWAVWRDFEVQHGNDDTFRDMLRVRRSVQAVFASQINVHGILAAAADAAAASAGKSDTARQAFTPAKEASAAAVTPVKREGTAMEALEQQAVAGASSAPSEADPSNPEALDIDI